MIIDVIFIALMAFAVFKGMSKGFIQSLFSLVAFFIGLAAALKLSAVVSNYLSAHFKMEGKWLPFLSFVLVFASFIILFFYLGKFFEKTTEMMMLGWLNKFGGVCLYMLLNGILFSTFLFYAVQMHLFTQQNINDSFSYPYISPLAPAFTHYLGKLIPFFKDIFLQLEEYFDNIAVRYQ